MHATCLVRAQAKASWESTPDVRLARVRLGALGVVSEGDAAAHAGAPADGAHLRCLRAGAVPPAPALFHAPATPL